MKNLKNKNRKQIDRKSILILTFFGVIIFGAITFQVFKVSPDSPEANEISNEGVNDGINESANEIQRIPNELVCMVNDAFMGKKQIIVPVGEKIYYGCCEMCVDKLQNIRELRYAMDPYSGNEVDKASAFIMLKGDGSDAVLYFESEENYYNYRDK